MQLNHEAVVHSQMMDAMPWEYAEILKILPHSVSVVRSSNGVCILADGASYQIVYYPKVQEFDFLVASLGEAKLNDVKLVLKVFFPYSYEQAFQYLMDIKGEKEVSVVLDGRNLSTEFYIDEGIMIIGLAP